LPAKARARRDGVNLSACLRACASRCSNRSVSANRPDSPHSLIFHGKIKRSIPTLRDYASVLSRRSKSFRLMRSMTCKWSGCRRKNSR